METEIGAVQTFLQSVPGLVFRLDEYDLAPSSHSPQPARSAPLKFADSSKMLILTNVPANDIMARKKENYQSEGEIPDYFRHPLLKTHLQTSLGGSHSGIRSAIIPFKGQLIRFKGCGNMYERFPLIKVGNHPNCLQIRGCMFEHTCLRELYITGIVNQTLAQENIPWANKPLGWFEYQTLPTELFPTVKRMCGIHETRGDKRLADDLLFGLESRLPDLFSESECDIALEMLEAIGRVDTSAQETRISATWIPILTESSLLNAVEFLEAVVSDQSKAMVHLYYRLGYDAGRILAILHQRAHISWGTFDDLLGFHCNAHPNNLVVLGKSYRHATPSGSLALMAPLDFDLAYTRDEFSGSQDRWDDLLKIELNALKMALGGDDSNSGVSHLAEVPTEYAPVRWALRDTLVSGFVDGHAGLEPRVRASSDTLTAMLEIIDLILQ